MPKGVRHGLRFTAEYAAYYAARQRCTNQKHPGYKDYGKRGIRFKFDSFLEFYREIGPKPSRFHILDRENNDGHYESGNVRWITQAASNVNKRHPSRTRARIVNLHRRGLTGYRIAKVTGFNHSWVYKVIGANQ